MFTDRDESGGVRVKVVAEVSLVPVGTKETGVSQYVAEAIRVLHQESEKGDLFYTVGAMATTIEGPIDRVWGAIRAMQEAIFRAGAQRVITTLRIDDRRDKEESIDRKVRAVEKKGVPIERRSR